MVQCSNCGTANDAGHKFCSNCGTALALTCGTCGTVNEAGHKFCFNCGSALSGEAAGSRPPSGDAVSDPGERRLVSVLFADLVGFTTFSEGRDPEEVRGMLTRYYESCREIIARYGGETDKFIGDAVMGVWGAVSANEDDAERATRAGLELVDMVEGLGASLSIDGLSARAGVLSGEASVGSGGNQGLVVGDLVNTASRLQSIAPPGGVYVGRSTRDLVGPSIEFAEAGTHEVKGKDVPVEAFQAMRVLALSTARSGGGELAEAPFVGRDDELRLLKDQLHATGRESRARMVSIIGEGGIGKTRLSTELLRYIDGIAEVVYYHRGRSPSYGDGVTYWALGEMIRQRAGITEGEDPAKARIKLRTTVAQHTENEQDQSWIEPRLAALIGLAAMPSGDRSELFGALRSFFQAISSQGTVLMVFEDLHWADEGMLDFIEELVERTTSHPIFVLALARPELLDRRPDWVAGRKRTLGMHLGRLDDESMRELVEGLAPGIPEAVIAKIAERTAGVPLHAVEFVRMLVNTDQLVSTPDGYRFEGHPDELAIPDSVNAAIGARLDRLDERAQELIKDASILGLSFSPVTLAELGSVEPEELEQDLRELVRREVLDFNEDPRSPERGQYRFVQGLIREVAYGRMSRAERVSRHLEAARLFEAADDPELAMVVASHYADAVEADPGNQELVDRCMEAVVQAAERAESLRSNAQAANLFERAADMATDPVKQARLRLEAARCIGLAGREDRAADLARQALGFYRDQGDAAGERRAATTLSGILAGSFDADNAIATVLPLYEATEPSETEDWTRLAVATSRALMLGGNFARAVEVADDVLPVLETLEMVDDICNVLIDKGTALGAMGRWLEGSAVLRGAADIAGDRDLTGTQIRALNNLSVVVQPDDQNSRELFEEIGSLIGRIGRTDWQLRYAFFTGWTLLFQGKLDEAADRAALAEELELSEFWQDNFRALDIRLELAAEGSDAELIDEWVALVDKYASSDDPQMRDAMAQARVESLFWAGRYEEAITAGIAALPGETNQYPQAAEPGVVSAFLAGDAEALSRFLDLITEHFPRGRASRGLAGVTRAFATILEGEEEEGIAQFAAADQLWEDVATPMALAIARAALAIGVGNDNPVVAEKGRQAREFFETAGIQIFLDQLISRIPDAGEVEVAV